jgi:hypothetical protein
LSAARVSLLATTRGYIFAPIEDASEAESAVFAF